MRVPRQGRHNGDVGILVVVPRSAQASVEAMLTLSSSHTRVPLVVTSASLGIAASISSTRPARVGRVRGRRGSCSRAPSSPGPSGRSGHVGEVGAQFPDALTSD